MTSVGIDSPLSILVKSILKSLREDETLVLSTLK